MAYVCSLAGGRRTTEPISQWGRSPGVHLDLPLVPLPRFNPCINRDVTFSSTIAVLLAG